MCPNGGDYENGRETKGLKTIIYGGMNASIATIFFIRVIVPPPGSLSGNLGLLREPDLKGQPGTNFSN